ncbi:MAG: hypothetical protein KDA61_11690, partial [Planctomycetales bacterium]|nr:hypothetical protein [Planctomycetales bacterium]
CKEVTETYQLEPRHMIESTLLKRRTFPWCTVGMLTVVVVGALGAASDPGTGRPNTQDMSTWHLAGAFTGFTIVAFTYYKAWTAIVANQDVIARIVALVQKIRAERGLDVADTPPA